MNPPGLSNSRVNRRNATNSANSARKLGCQEDEVRGDVLSAPVSEAGDRASSSNGSDVELCVIFSLLWGIFYLSPVDVLLVKLL